MPTHIDRMVTDVAVEAEPEAASTSEDERWAEAERLAKMLERKQQLQLRTQAEGFDD